MHMLVGEKEQTSKTTDYDEIMERRSQENESVQSLIRPKVDLIKCYVK